MLRVFYKNLKMLELEERQRFERGTLIELVDPSQEEIDGIRKELKIDTSLIRDALDPFEVPRMEQQHETTYVFLRFPDKEEDGMANSIPFLIILGDHFVLFASKKQLPIIEELNKSLEGITTTQQTKMVLQILQVMHDAYKNILHDINHDINHLNLRARGESISNNDIMSFIAFEETLNDFLNSLVPYSVVLSRLLDGTMMTLYNEDKDMIKDLILGGEELVQLAKTSLKSSSNIRNAYSTILTNNLNRVIKFLTSLTIILTVAVIIPSIYGMNIDLPFQNNPNAFIIVMGFTAVIAVVLLWFFNKKKWL